MSHVHDAPADWAGYAHETLAQAGYRRGGARSAVVDLLAKQGCGLSAFEIEAKLARGRGRSVARASVYRILEELESLRLVTRLDLGQGLARFEPASAQHHHHHMVCDDCGDVVPFEDAALERSIARLSDKVTFAIAEHEVVLRGTCPDCVG